VRAIVPADPANVDQSEVGLVDESSGLQDVAGAFVRHVPAGDTPEVFLDERREPIEGGDRPSRRRAVS